MSEVAKVRVERVWKSDRDRVLAAVPGGFTRGDTLIDGLTGGDDVCSRCGLATVEDSDPPPAILYVGPFTLGGRVMKLVYCGRCRSAPPPIEAEVLRPAADLADGRTDHIDDGEREEKPEGRGAPSVVEDAENDPDDHESERDDINDHGPVPLG